MTDQKLDVVVVGAGVAGLYALYRLRSMGFTVKVIEAADRIGGTWHWNRYPGAQCDAQSMGYSYHFSKELEQEWTWTNLYASQPEVLEYLEYVSSRFKLHNDIELSTKVLSAHYDETNQAWVLQTNRDSKLLARFCVMATGCLSKVNFPGLPDLEKFQGQYFHSGQWPNTPVSFEGKRVGVIGTGTSGVQIIPEIAKTASQLTVFQKTPVYCLPAKNRSLNANEVKRVKDDLEAFRRLPLQGAVGFDFDSNSPSQPETLSASESEIQSRFEECWNQGGFRIFGAFKGLRGQILKDKKVNDQVAGFIRSKIRSIVKDSNVAEKLCPKVPILCKRPALSDSYYETYNCKNVTLVDLRAEPIQEVRNHGIKTVQQNYDLDIIVFATGFDAMTGALLNINPSGKAQLTLSEQWRKGPKSYLGLAVNGFPNLFIVNGPLSPGVLTNMIATSENQVDWIARCIAATNQKGKRSVEASESAQASWVNRAQELANGTLFPTVSSWYMGDNIVGKPRGFLMYLDSMGYQTECVRVAQADFEGFIFT